jgi:hypothetical protein
MTQEQFDKLVKEVGEKAASDIKTRTDAFEKSLNEKYEAMMKGTLTVDEFKKFKDEELKAINEGIKSITDLEKTVKAQGDLINDMKKEGGAGVRKSMEEWFEEQMPSFKELRNKKVGEVEFTAADLRKAGVVGFNKVAATTSVAGSVTAMDTPPGSPYLPGLGNETLQLFEIVRNPNFIINRVNVGRTNQFRLAWINETDYQGTPDTNIAEGGTKPQTQHIFKVEISTAKKAAAWIELTEEFEDDLPGLSTAVRRMLQNDVMREFDNEIQTAVIAAARPYEITGLDAKVPFTTLFDSIGALLAQIGFYNFIPNTVALNPVTDWTMLMDKDAEGRYLNPPFLNRINALLVDATKVAVGYGLVGDLSQYNVDIYKDFSLRIGWINDEFIKNKFAILGELRYHNYISETRKKAIVYNQLAAVQSKITAGS